MHPLISTVMGWLRSGYPEGVPPKDYFPLLAVLQRKLTDQEIREVVDALIEDGDTPIEVAEIEDTIVRLTREMPLDDDVRRVAVRLAAGGWPLADPVNPDGATGPEQAREPADAEGPRHDAETPSASDTAGEVEPSDAGASDSLDAGRAHN